MRWCRVVSVLSVLAVACSDPAPAIQPITSRGPRPTTVETPPEILAPSSFLRERTAAARAAERERLGLTGGGGPSDSPGGVVGGGGGGGGGWQPPSPAPRPTARQVERFRRELERQLAGRIEPDDDPCEQLRQTMIAGIGASERPGSESPPDPTRAAMRRACRAMPSGYLQCMDQEYFREHIDECRVELERFARRGRRISDRARARLQDIDREARGALRSPRDPDPDDEDGEDG